MHLSWDLGIEVSRKHTHAHTQLETKSTQWLRRAAYILRGSWTFGGVPWSPIIALVLGPATVAVPIKEESWKYTKKNTQGFKMKPIISSIAMGWRHRRINHIFYKFLGFMILHLKRHILALHIPKIYFWHKGLAEFPCTCQRHFSCMLYAHLKNFTM